MRERFRTVYNENELNDLWQECVFVFDTNVLMHLYESSPKTRKVWLDLLLQIKKQGRKLWLPYQFAYEYHQHILTIDSDIQEKYIDLAITLPKCKKIVEKLQNAARI